jgi:hypothetical protein
MEDKIKGRMKEAAVRDRQRRKDKGGLLVMR